MPDITYYKHGYDRMEDMAERIQEFINREIYNLKLERGLVISDIDLDIVMMRGPYYETDSSCNGVTISLDI